MGTGGGGQARGPHLAPRAVRVEDAGTEANSEQLPLEFIPGNLFLKQLGKKNPWVSFLILGTPLRK